MIESPDINLGEDFGLGPVLRCPHCNSDYLHHIGVASFDREEDEPLVRMTTVDKKMVAVQMKASDKSGNPSSRRDGIIILFYCEECRADPRLTIAQHKGNTVLMWEYAAPNETASAAVFRRFMES